MHDGTRDVCGQISGIASVLQGSPRQELGKLNISDRLKQWAAQPVGVMIIKTLHTTRLPAELNNPGARPPQPMSPKSGDQAPMARLSQSAETHRGLRLTIKKTGKLRSPASGNQLEAPTLRLHSFGTELRE